MDGKEIALARLGDVVDWLDRAGISLRRIGEVTSTSHANVRAIVSRHRRRQPVPTPTARPSSRWVRDGELWEDELSVERRESYERLEDRLRETVKATWTTYDFDWGVRRLKWLGQFFGFPSHTHGVRLLAYQQLQLALFNVHQGRTRRSVKHARAAFDLYRRDYRTLHDSDGIRGVIEALGAFAHACLLAHKPRAALRVLDDMETLHRNHNVPMLAEFFRKRGVAFLQLARADRDDDARRAFAAAAATPVLDNNPLERRMAGGRHLNLLNGSYDSAAELLHEAATGYGANSLQKSMCVHWSAAAAFATDSTRLHQEAYDLLRQNEALTKRFGHQATISFLLSRTAAFGIPASLRREWVRVALYSNAFRAA